MNTIARFVIISLKKNFVYKINGVMVIVDTFLDVLSVWLFWMSLAQYDIAIGNWTMKELTMFMGFSLIATAIGNMGVGAYDIQRAVLDGTLDLYLVRPYSSIAIIMAERPNVIRFFISFIAGIILVGSQCSYYGIGNVIIAGIFCVLSALIINHIQILIYMASFWSRQMDTVANVYDTITSISSFPLVVLSKKIMYCLTYILPIGFMAMMLYHKS